MWEPSRANPQLLFDVSLEIAASWQRLPPGACVQRGQPFPRCLHEPPLEPGGFPPTPEQRGRSFGAGAGVSLPRTATRSNHCHGVRTPRMQQVSLVGHVQPHPVPVWGCSQRCPFSDGFPGAAAG